MAEQELQKEIEFIGRYIVSVEQLEILLLLSDSPERFWTSEEVFQKIQSSQASVLERLKGLCEQGFLKCEENGQSRFQFKPVSAELAEGLSDLKKAYHLRRVKIIETIFSKPVDTVRNFADAFKFRKDK